MSNERYTIVVSGERLVFTRDQIESDSGNYFATYFFGDFAESTRGIRELAVEKDVHLFRLIQAHLRGYSILPLADTAIPLCMTKEGALMNLLGDAQYYGLQLLEDKIQNFISRMPDDSSTKSRKDAARTYKFARFKNGNWFINDTTLDGYTIILGRIKDHPEKAVYANHRPICPGYKQVICWKDDPADLGSALLVSDD